MHPHHGMSDGLEFGDLTVLVGERIYRRSLLQSGGRVTLRQAWRAED